MREPVQIRTNFAPDDGAISAIDKGVLITGEGVHPSEKGALARKTRGGKITATDGPFTEAKEVIGGIALINADDRAEAVKFAQRYAALFGEVEVEVRQVVEDEDLPAPDEAAPTS